MQCRFIENMRTLLKRNVIDRVGRNPVGIPIRDEVTFNPALQQFVLGFSKSQELARIRRWHVHIVSVHLRPSVDIDHLVIGIAKNVEKLPPNLFVLDLGATQFLEV